MSEAAGESRLLETHFQYRGRQRAIHGMQGYVPHHQSCKNKYHRCFVQMSQMFCTNVTGFTASVQNTLDPDKLYIACCVSLVQNENFHEQKIYYSVKYVL